MQRVWQTVPALGVVMVLACSSTPEKKKAEEPQLGSAVILPQGRAPERRFTFITVDGKYVTHRNFLGRMTVVALVTTYDDPSLLQIRFLKSVVQNHTPRI